MKTVKLGSGKWATKKGALLAHANTDLGNYIPVPFRTVTRASTGTYVARDGLIKTAQADEPRIEFLNEPNGYLLTEPQSTNLLTYSQDFSQWTQGNTITTINNITSPDGLQNADKVVGDGVAAFPRVSMLVNTSGIVTLSTYCKRLDKDTFNLYVTGTGLGVENDTVINYEFNFITKTFISITGATAESTFFEELNNDWFRVGIVVESTTITDFRLYTDWNVVTSGGVYFWGAQVEQLSYPTSYIKTESATVTRIADAIKDCGSDLVFNSVEGVMFIDMSGLGNADTNRRMSLSDGTGNNRVVISFNPSNNLSILVIVASVSQFSQGFGIVDPLFLKIALVWSLNKIQFWVDGVLISEDLSNTTFAPNVLTQLQFEDGGGGIDFYGKTKALTVYPSIADAQVDLPYIT